MMMAVVAATSSVPSLHHQALLLHSYGFSGNPASHHRCSPSLLSISSQALSARTDAATTSTSSTDRLLLPPKIKRFSHLSPLLPQLVSVSSSSSSSSSSSDEVSVSSILQPFLHSLSGEDWNILVSEVGLKNWRNCLEVFHIFAEEERKKKKKNNKEATDNEGNASIILKIYTSLIRVLSKNGRNEEVKDILEKMKEEEITMDAAFYNALFRSYSERGQMAEISQGFLQMEASGIKPDRLTYEILISACLHEESVDIEKSVKILEDMIKNGLSVGANTFRDLISGYWKIQNLEGAENIFGLMQAAGHHPELKVVLKLMQLNGRKGNHKRTSELFKLLKESGVKKLDAAYIYHLHAYCKAGLLKQARESFNKYQTVTGKKPSLVAFNMIIDACGKQGLSEEALQYYIHLCNSGLRPNVVSYCSIISTMVKAGKFKKAEELYNKMLAKGIEPNLYVYATMIHCYTKCKSIARGHELYLSMKKSQIHMTDTAYGSILALYIGCEWYGHAADVLRELETQGFNLDIASHGLLIRTFAKVDDKMKPLLQAVEASKFAVCKLLAKLSLGESPNHFHLSPILYEKVIGFLDGLKDEDEARTTLIQLYNAFLDYFWQRGLTGTSKMLLEKARKVYALNTRPRKHSKEWTLDVRGLSVGGAIVAVIDWLLDAEDNVAVSINSSDLGNLNMVLITGGTEEPQFSTSLKGFLLGFLKKHESPFIESSENPKKIQAAAADVVKWVSQGTFKEKLGFIV